MKYYSGYLIYRHLHKRISRLLIHATASSSALCNLAIPPLNLVLWQSSMICWMVCSAPHSHKGELIMPHLYRRLLLLPWLVLALFKAAHMCQGRLKPGTLSIGSTINVKFCTPESFQRFFTPRVLILSGISCPK